MIKRKQNPFPTNLKIQDLINIKLENKIKALENKIKELEQRLSDLETKTIVSLSPLPSNIKDFHLCQINNYESSYDDLYLE